MFLVPIYLYLPFIQISDAQKGFFKGEVAPTQNSYYYGIFFTYCVII